MLSNIVQNLWNVCGWHRVKRISRYKRTACSLDKQWQTWLSACKRYKQRVLCLCILSKELKHQVALFLLAYRKTLWLFYLWKKINSRKKTKQKKTANEPKRHNQPTINLEASTNRILLMFDHYLFSPFEHFKSTVWTNVTLFNVCCSLACEMYILSLLSLYKLHVITPRLLYMISNFTGSVYLFWNLMLSYLGPPNRRRRMKKSPLSISAAGMHAGASSENKKHTFYKIHICI